MVVEDETERRNMSVGSSISEWGEGAVLCGRNFFGGGIFFVIARFKFDY